MADRGFWVTGTAWLGPVDVRLILRLHCIKGDDGVDALDFRRLLSSQCADTPQLTLAGSTLLLSSYPKQIHFLACWSVGYRALLSAASNRLTDFTWLIQEC